MNSQPTCTAYHPECIAPAKATIGSAGFDLSSVETVEIPPGGRALVSTGLAIKCPTGTYGRIAPRSGLSIRNGINVLGGVIDPDYTGIVKAILHNTSTEPFTVDVGMKMCQIIFERYETFPVTTYINMKFADGEEEMVTSTDRGTRGFGSSGLYEPRGNDYKEFLKLRKDLQEGKARDPGQGRPYPDPVYTH